MDKTIREGKLNEIMGKARVWWSKLTQDDLIRIAGRFEILVGVLQEKYGYSRRQAVQEVSQHVINYRSAIRELRSRSKNGL